MRRIIDFHVHPWLRSEDNLSAYPHTLASQAPAEVLRTDLRRLGIVRCTGSVIRADAKVPLGDFAAIRRGHDDALALAASLGDFYLPGMMVHPSFVRESCEEMERMHKKGVRLIGELVPYMQGWGPLVYTEAGLDEILTLAAELSMLVSFHSMDMASAHAMVKKHPRLNFVAAHPGERPNYLEHLAFMKESPNYYLDLSGTGLFRYGMLAHGVRSVGAERFLFGSDYPICSPAMNIAGVENEGITEQEKELIFSKNAERLLGL